MVYSGSLILLFVFQVVVEFPLNPMFILNSTFLILSPHGFPLRVENSEQIGFEQGSEALESYKLQ